MIPIPHRIRDVFGTNVARHLGASVNPFVMDNDKNTIGLGDLLEDITVSLSTFARSNPSYYSMSLVVGSWRSHVWRQVRRRRLLWFL